MIDKLILNNQIITNKRKIHQARIQTINKLVQKIRKLKILNEKKPQNAKINKNLDKLLKIMHCLKKFKIVDIIQKILTLSKKPTAIITNGQATPDDVAIALLACNKILTGIVGTLRSVLNLNDSNPGWQNEILELSRRKKKIIEFSERKMNKKIKNNKKHPKMLVKTLPWKEETPMSNETDHIFDDCTAPVPKGWKEEMISDTAPEPSLSKELVKSKSRKSEEKPKLTISKQIHEQKKLVNEKPVTIVDSFFFTETGDNYMSTVVVDRVQPEPTQDGLIRSERRDNKIRPNKRNNIFRKPSAPNLIEFDKKRRSIQSGRIEKRESFVPKSNIISKEVVAANEKLHPSWAAKQKLKPTITEFKGHKITFDNDGNDMAPAPVKSANKINKPPSQNKDISTASSQENLHPSWAAKLRQKPAITEFKGSKITFDD